MLAGAVILLVAAGSVAAWSVAANRAEADDLLPNLAQAVPDELSGRTGGSVAEPTFFLGFKSAAASGTGHSSCSAAVVASGRRR